MHTHAHTYMHAHAHAHTYRDALLELAAGCPQLERAHLIKRMGEKDDDSPDEFLTWVRTWTNLNHLDLSMGYRELGTGTGYREQLLKWLEERQQCGRPVRSLVVHDCHWYDADLALSAHEEMALLTAFKAEALAVCPTLQVNIGLEGLCEWTEESEMKVREFGVPRSWLLPRQRMFDAIGL